jgi:FKBP-type peptidyl-prolyl cis-trans isomerase FkpA
MKKLVGIGLMALLFLGCKKTGSGPEQDCTYDPCAIKAPATEIENVRSYLTTNNITNAVEHCSGVFYVIESQGSGIAPDVCSFITAGYVGKLTNGNIFDQSPPGQYLQIYLSQLIKGWINVLPNIKAGGKIHLYIPPSLGYGAADQKDRNGAVVIPGNSITIFDIELVQVN